MLRSHDVRHLLARWKRVAKGAGLRHRTLAKVSGYAVPVLQSRKPAPDQPAVYLSSGVHGDETGSLLGLLLWAESHLEKLRAGHFMIFPLLNPWGVLENRRHDEDGLDLNRSFHRRGHPLIDAWRSELQGRRFSVCVNLHEDYDAEGCYLYELSRRPWIGEQLIEAVAPFMSPDSHGTIDGRRANAPGVMRVRKPPVLEGDPEAIALFKKHTDLAITFETPSEGDLHKRAEAHGVFLDALLLQADESLDR